MCLDEMGPQAVKSYPGKQLVYPEAAEAKPAGRAKQIIDYGRRGKAGYVFGALKPVDGEVFTATYTRRKLVNWIDFLNSMEEADPQRRGAGLCRVRQSEHASSHGCALLQSSLSALGVRLATDCCGLFEPDRTVVEDTQFVGLQRKAL